MNKEPADKRKTDEDSFAALVAAKAARKAHARSNPAPGIWWLDANFPRSHSWTLALLVAGLVLGCANAWHWVSQQDQAAREESRNDDE